MNKYIVYTSVGEYVVWADSHSQARRKVYDITFGRATDMTVVRAG